MRETFIQPKTLMGDDRVRPFDTLFHRHSGPPCLLSIIKTIIRPIPFLLPKEIKWLAIAVIKVRICPHVMCRERVFPAPLVLHAEFLIRTFTIL